MLYLYAITEPLVGTLEAIRGVDQGPLMRIEEASLGAVVSSVGGDYLAPSPWRLAQHERVVEALMAQFTVIPARYSTIFDHEEALREHLRGQRHVLKEELSRLDGCVELGLRVIRVTPNPPLTSEGDGLPCPDLLLSEKMSRTFDVACRAAAMQQAALRRRDESLGEIIHRELAAIARDDRMFVAERGGMLFRASYLVAHEHLSEMRTAVVDFMQEHRHLHFMGTGPWPPYHFVRAIEPVRSVS